MTTELQRDFGRVEAHVEVIQKDVEQIKTDLAAIRTTLAGKRAIVENDKARLAGVAVLAAILSHAINWLKPFMS